MTSIVWIVAGTLTFIVALFVLMARPANIRIRIAGDELLVESMDLDKIWCVRSEITTALDRVASIEIM